MFWSLECGPSSLISVYEPKAQITTWDGSNFDQPVSLGAAQMKRPPGPPRLHLHLGLYQN